MGVETGCEVVRRALRYLVLSDIRQNHHIVVLTIAFVTGSVSKIVVD